MTEEIVELASRYGRYGYRRVTALLRMEGWDVNHKRVERIWRREGLKVPAKQPKRGRLWLNDGSCVRLRPQGPNHVWAYDFVLARTQDSRAVRLLTVIDEYTRECLAIRADRQIRSSDVREKQCYLYYDWLGERPEVHRREVDLFDECVGDEIRFKALTYQEVFEKLTEYGQAGSEYLDYLETRYFTRMA